MEYEKVLKKFSKYRNDIEKLKEEFNSMTWNQFIEKLNKRIDETIIRKESELQQKIIGGTCTITKKTDEIYVVCVLYYVDKNDSFQAIELSYKIPTYKFAIADESTNNIFRELEEKPFEFKVVHPNEEVDL